MISNLRLSLILICLFCTANSELLFSQSIDYINGKVINTTTLMPVPFATIKLKNKQLGVFANADGDFKMISNPEFQSDSLIVTCIGFKRSSLPFKRLSGKTINKIFLTPAIYGLSEVKVVVSRKKLSSITIITRAIRNIKNNYPKKPYNYISYYRDYQKKGGNYINLNEAIVETIDNGFTSKSTSNKFRLIDFKKNMDFPRMNITPYYDNNITPYGNSSNKNIPNALIGDQYGNELFILLVHDPIRNFKTRSFSFIGTFSEDFLLNHDFSEPTKVFNNNLVLYKIDFNAKPQITGDSLQVSGSIYIQPKDYSIHKLEYLCSNVINGEGKKKMFNIDVEYGYENSIDSLMYLKYISFNNIFNVSDSADLSYFQILDSYWEASLQFKKNEFPNLNVILEFNNSIDPQSASNKENYEIRFGNKTAKIRSIEVEGRKIYIRVKNENFRGSLDSCKVTVQNIKDNNGNILNKRKYIELYQYRELFVQEYNKSIPFKDSCYLRYLPLEQNCLSNFPGKEKYWMNTPENIKIDK